MTAGIARIDEARGGRRCVKCGRRAMVLDSGLCSECDEQLGYLALWVRRARARDQARRERSWIRHEAMTAALGRARARVRRWLWVPELVLVLAVLIYLAWRCGVAYAEWRGWL